MPHHGRDNAIVQSAPSVQTLVHVGVVAGQCGLQWVLSLWCTILHAA